MNTDRRKAMSLSKKTADVCIVLLTLILLGILAADVSQQMYVRISGQECTDSPQKIYTNIVPLGTCAFSCFSSSCSTFTYNEVTKECRIHSGKCSTFDIAPAPYSISFDVAVDTVDAGDTAKTRCEDFNPTISNASGVYQVYPRPDQPRQYYCYYAGDNGLWNVIQYRYDGSEDFNRTWDEYKSGFGSLTQEFWLGNDEIHRLTVGNDSMLRVELEHPDERKKYAQYNTFYVDDEQGKYKLTIGGYTGTAGDAFNTYHNGMYFSTWDRDNDDYVQRHCAVDFSAGYWYKKCYENNLNGEHHKLMKWKSFNGKGKLVNMKVSRMMVRKK